VFRVQGLGFRAPGDSQGRTGALLPSSRCTTGALSQRPGSLRLPVSFM